VQLKATRVRNKQADDPTRFPGRLLKRGFLEAPPEYVAPRLLGKVLVHRTRHGVVAGRMVEVEAYLGPHNEQPDPAAHSHRGPTPRNQVLFGPAGHAYVYSIYGQYYCMNITCEREGRAGCILVRALDPVAGLEQMARNRGLEIDAATCDLTGGPSRLCQAMGLSRAAHNGLDLLDASSPLQVRDDGYHVKQVLVTRRIGIRHAVELPLRFAIPGHHCVSGPKSLSGETIFLRARSVRAASR
jgi:DNA-3-methyladenine glycosylase